MQSSRLKRKQLLQAALLWKNQFLWLRKNQEGADATNMSRFLQISLTKKAYKCKQVLSKINQLSEKWEWADWIWLKLVCPSTLSSAGLVCKVCLFFANVRGCQKSCPKKLSQWQKLEVLASFGLLLLLLLYINYCSSHQTTNGQTILILSFWMTIEPSTVTQFWNRNNSWLFFPFANPNPKSSLNAVFISEKFLSLAAPHSKSGQNSFAAFLHKFPRIPKSASSRSFYP